MSFLFENKTALVTGASSGIGRATAIAFARAGARVALLDINAHEGKSVEEAIRANKGEALFLHCNVANATEVDAAMRSIVERFGRVDVAFNNAGIEGERADLADSTEENWDRVIDINLKSVWLCMKHELQLMQSAGSGVIVNCASVAGLVGFKGIPAYVASKHGIVGLTKAAALEYARQGIRVNAVCPGVIRTPMVERYTRGDPETEKMFAEQEPVGRLGEPEEIANAVLWLCTDRASFVTGQAIAVDGGWTTA